MSTADFQHLKVSMVKDVAVIELTHKDLRGPEAAQALGSELYLVAAQEWARKLLVDFRYVRYLSSTGFAVLVKMVSQAKESGRQVQFCNIDPDVRIGADIVGLPKIVEMHDSEASAMRAFT